MYYSIALTSVTSTSPSHLKPRLRHNICLALSDIQVLLEPSEENILAVVLALTHASEFTGPSLCWMLATSACRMLQALGLDRHRLDPETWKKRHLMFWHLNLMDKGFAVIYGPAPTFHRGMIKQVGFPTLDQMQPARAHTTATGSPGFFASHFTHQKFLLSLVLEDVWHCLHGDEKPTFATIIATRNTLSAWYDETLRVCSPWLYLAKSREKN